MDRLVVRNIFIVYQYTLNLSATFATVYQSYEIWARLLTVANAGSAIKYRDIIACGIPSSSASKRMDGRRNVMRKI